MRGSFFALLLLAAASASAQQQPPQKPTVNAWDALEDGLSRDVRIDGCTMGACTFEALVLDNQAVGDCLEDALATGRYTLDGRDFFGAQLIVKVDAETLAATRYYRVIVRVPQAGLQRICVRRTMQQAGLHYTIALDRPETTEQLAQSAGVHSRNNRSREAIRLGPFVNSRSTQATSASLEKGLAHALFGSDSQVPIKVAIRSPGGGLPISLEGAALGYTDKTIFAPPATLLRLAVQREGEKVPLSSCESVVQDILLVVSC